MKSYMIVKRYEYEEPYDLHLEFFLSNGSFRAVTDLYSSPGVLSDLGKALKSFPKNNKDEYRFTYGSDEKDNDTYFILRAYVLDSLGHSAIQFKIRNYTKEPYEG